MQPNNTQNQNNIPTHVPISQLKDQLANKNNVPILNQGKPVNNNQPIIITPNLNKQTPAQPAFSSPPASVATTTNAMPTNTTETSSSTINTPPTDPSPVSPTPQLANINQPDKTPIKLLVVIQFISLFVIVFGFYPSPLFTVFSLMISGVIMIALGLFLGIWSYMSFHQKISISPVPLKHSFLVTGGPFKYIRHPMYATLLLISVGLLLVYPSITRILAVIALIVVLNIKMNIEEKLLAERYHHYGRYQRITGKLLPKLHKPKIDIDIDLPKFE